MADASTAQLANNVKSLGTVIERLSRSVADLKTSSGKSIINDAAGTDNKQSIKTSGGGLTFANDAGVKKIGALLSAVFYKQFGAKDQKKLDDGSSLESVTDAKNESFKTAAEENAVQNVMIAGFSDNAVQQITNMFKSLKLPGGQASSKKESGGGFFSNLFSGLAKAAGFIGPVLVLVGGIVAIMWALKEFGVEIDVGKIAAIAGVIVLLGGALWFVGKIMMPMMGTFGRFLIEVGLAVIAFAVGIGVLAGALYLFSYVPWESILKGGLTILGVGLFVALAGQALVTAAPALLTFSLAFGILTLAFFAFSFIPWDAILKGLLVMASMGLIIGVLAAVLSPLLPVLIPMGAVFLAFSIAILAMGAAFMLVGAGVWLFAKGIAAFGDVSLEALGKFTLFVTGMALISPLLYMLGMAMIPLGIGMVAVGAGAIMMGLGFLAAGAGLVIFAAGVYLLSFAFKAFGEVSGEAIAKVVVALSLLTPAIIGLSIAFITAAPGFIAFAAAILIIAVAFAIVGIVCWAFGEEIVAVAAGIGNAVANVFNSIGSVITSFFDGISKVVDTVGSVIKNLMETAISGVERIAQIDSEKLFKTAAGIAAITAAMLAFAAGAAAGGLLSAVGSFFSGGKSALGDLINLAGAADKLTNTSGIITSISAALKVFGDAAAVKGSKSIMADLIEATAKAAAGIDNTTGDKIRSFGIAIGSFKTGMVGVDIATVTAMTKLFEASKNLPSGNVSVTTAHHESITAEGTLQIDMSETNNILISLRDTSAELLSKQLNELQNHTALLEDVSNSLQNAKFGGGSSNAMIGSQTKSSSVGGGFRERYREQHI